MRTTSPSHPSGWRRSTESVAISPFGGANCEGGMGLSLLQSFPFVDYVCLGEGDDTFVTLVESLASGEVRPVIGNIIHRNTATIHQGSVASQRPALDGLPIPEYDDYFAELREQSLLLNPSIPVEFSRGCWWGAKHHCTFCGLNGSSMSYSSKSPSRAITELDFLASRYGTSFLWSDNIFDLRYLRSVFPVLATGSRRYEIFLETKANLRKDQIRLLRSAGVRRLQPGIESLSTHVLKLMRKGTSMLQNVQTLKWCKELGVGVSWNLLTGFPGEQREDYQRTLALVPLLRHLEPPMGCGAVRIDRFSPFQSTPELFGFRCLHAHEAYETIYPLSAERVDALAYYFQAEHAEEPASVEFSEELTVAVAAWRATHDMCRLTHELDGRELIVRDSRIGSEITKHITGLAAAILLACERIQSIESLSEGFLSSVPHPARKEIRTALALLQRLGLVIEEDNKYLSLAIPAAIDEARYPVLTVHADVSRASRDEGVPSLLPCAEPHYPLQPPVKGAG